MGSDRSKLTRLGIVVITLAWLSWGLINATRLHIDIGLSWSTALWYGLPDAVIWAALTPLIAWICRRLPIRRDNIARRLPLHALIALVISVGHNALDASLHAVRRMLEGEPANFVQTFTSVLQHTLHLNLVIYFLIVGFAHLFFYSKRLVERERQTAELRAQLSDARLQALRMQLQPHFLFNALHTISGLMATDVEAAQRVMRQLGELLRMSLDNGDRNEIRLEQELAFVRAYLEIEHARFRDRLRTRVEADPQLLSTPVPPFVLQPLVENAVRHGVSHNPDGGTVEIEARRRNGRIDLEVRDDGPGVGSPARAATGGQGVGLANTRKRLEELYHGRARLVLVSDDRGGHTATISIPLNPEIAE